MNKMIKYGYLTATASLLMLACNAGNTKHDQGQHTVLDSSVQEGFVAMLDSNTLKGWEGDSSYWRMESGILIGEIKADAEPLKNNTFLIWKGGEPGDFVLKSQFRISADGNSGINYRSERFTELPYALKGYQADIDGQHHYTGQNYEERNRTTLAYRGQQTEIPNPTAGESGASKGNAWSTLIVRDTLATAKELADAVKVGDWNEIEIVAKGNKLSHYINGKLISEVVDNDELHRKQKGLIGVQVHVGPPMKIEYKDMKIKMLD
ncbi:MULTISPECIES: DUF1080 domain-containing protein [Sphingobacterium]|uniref:3-keto-disaccharide hydrolase n=1 Tax=Sphingobacterium TaxID=28453 RepID=UPI00104351C1|nr:MULTISPECIES: DUF1080 domain-containing protein [Sphingobacterium]MCW2262823.1 hypothetical protein [Sphingobacterium kitahiroshimense]